jgi:hypothetical protein
MRIIAEHYIYCPKCGLVNDFTIDVQEIQRKYEVFNFKQSDEKDYMYLYKLKDLLKLFGTRKRTEKYSIVKNLQEV